MLFRSDDLRQNLALVTKKVVLDLEEAGVERATISMIQSMVENRLLGAGYITIAEHYISYRLHEIWSVMVMAIILQSIYILNKFDKFAV